MRGKRAKEIRRIAIAKAAELGKPQQADRLYDGLKKWWKNPNRTIQLQKQKRLAHQVVNELEKRKQ